MAKSGSDLLAMDTPDIMLRSNPPSDRYQRVTKFQQSNGVSLHFKYLPQHRGHFPP